MHSLGVQEFTVHLEIVFNKKLKHFQVPYFKVIFAIDLKINYNNYEKSLCALTTSKTIFTVNPSKKKRDSFCLICLINLFEKK